MNVLRFVRLWFTALRCIIGGRAKPAKRPNRPGVRPKVVTLEERDVPSVSPTRPACAPPAQLCPAAMMTNTPPGIMVNHPPAQRTASGVTAAAHPEHGHAHAGGGAAKHHGRARHHHKRRAHHHHRRKHHHRRHPVSPATPPPTSTLSAGTACQPAPATPAAPAPGSSPSVSGVCGSFAPGQQVTFRGIFARFQNQQPILWADFAQGIQPSGLFQKSQWDAPDGAVGNMHWEADGGRGGGGGAVGTPGNGAWTLGINHELQDGETVFLSRDVYRNFSVTNPNQNYKTFRYWHDALGGQPNFYFSVSNGRAYTEYATDPNGFWADTGKVALTAGGWVTESIVLRASSTSDKNDGYFALSYGPTVVAAGNIMTDVGGKHLNILFLYHEVIAREQWGGDWLSTNLVKADNIYFTEGQAHVFATDRPQVSESTRMEVLPTLSSPADGQVTVLVPDAGVFQKGETVYVHVTDDSGRTDLLGYAMTVG